MLTIDLAMHSRIWFEHRGAYLLGESELRLLEAIERVGSIKEAAKESGLSYRTAWARIQAMSHAMGTSVVKSRAGGPHGGTSALTDDTRRLVRLYTDVRLRVSEHAQRQFGEAVDAAG
jgi:molybdate transport system regulatory protein